MVGGGSESQGQGYLIASFILLLYLGKASKIWYVARKSPGSCQEVPRKSSFNCNPKGVGLPIARWDCLTIV